MSTVLKLALAFLGLSSAGVGAFLYSKDLPTTFLLHVLGMVTAFLALGPTAVLLKKLPGNTMLHARLMIAGGYVGSPVQSPWPPE